ncbi:hypothetical protein [Aquabacter spiritensis]|uniref:Uncharacterized protein n=1 Tax=Aquabacter spiritensis TaxID=933073 RepID=A0A4R3M5T2_9HYPH|nr:hypothetical protein [Aquabacter spiritensis]TCT06837.1 hypothetical protein EDC64_102317 [Aquabacter spiritensis]
MGSISRTQAERSIRMVIGNDEREISSLKEAKSFLKQHKAGALADFILSDMDAAAPGALVAFRNRLEMMRAAL